MYKPVLNVSAIMSKQRMRLLAWLATKSGNSQSSTDTTARKSPRMDTMPMDRQHLSVRVSVDCGPRPDYGQSGSDTYECDPAKSPCLFDLANDPCEYRNLAKQHPQVVSELLGRLERFKKTAVPVRNKRADPRSNPKLWGYMWTNWMDFV
jgi:hypothetical protein